MCMIIIIIHELEQMIDHESMYSIRLIQFCEQQCLVLALKPLCLSHDHDLQFLSHDEELSLHDLNCGRWSTSIPCRWRVNTRGTCVWHFLHMTENMFRSIVLVSTFTWYIAMVSYCHRHLDIGTLTWPPYFLHLLLIISSAEHTLPLFWSVTKHTNFK